MKGHVRVAGVQSVVVIVRKVFGDAPPLSSTDMTTISLLPAVANVLWKLCALPELTNPLEGTRANVTPPSNESK